MQVYALTIETDSIFGALAPGHGTEMHKQQNTDNSTETPTQTLSVTQSVYATSLLYPLHCIHSLHAFSLSCTLRLSKEVWCHGHHILWLRNDEHIQQHVISSKPSYNATTAFPCSSPWRQSVHLVIFSHSTSCLFNPSQTWLSRSFCLVNQSPSYFCFHVSLKTSRFPLDWLFDWDCVGFLPLGGGGVQVWQAPIGHKELSLRQEAWAQSSERDHRVCLHPWSEFCPEGTGSPWQKD